MTAIIPRVLSICLSAVWLCSLAAAQSVNSSQTFQPSQASAVVPRLVNYSGRAIDADGKIVSGTAGATFAIYSEQSGGAPLWIETQNITADVTGSYTVQLGATKPDGLPLDLFTTGEARWLGVRVNNGEEQPRVLLLSVPYALKAADAETVGGLPASAFLLAHAANSAAQSNAALAQSSVLPATSSDVTTSGGTANTLPLFTTATNVQSSILTQTGSGTTGKIGINMISPAATLDVNGPETVRGTLTLPAAGAATATAGKNSQATAFTASAYNSSTKAAVAQNFRWQAEPAANNTTAPSGTLNLLYGLGTAAPTETGLKLSSKGVFTFAPGQTFPGGGAFCIATGGGFGSGGTTFVAPSFTVPAENKCASWSGFTKTASTVILNTSGAACLSTTGKTLTVSVSSLDPDFLGTNPAVDYIQLTRASSTGAFTGGTDQGEFSGSADQITCTSSLLSLPDVHD